MSLLPSYFKANKRTDEPASAPEPANDSHEDVFRLIPPRPPEKDELAELFEPPPPAAPPESGRDIHPVGTMDLTRLSIDNDGRLYWDGKPVEVHRRIMMSRPQVVGASIIGAFVIIGAIAAAIQGSAAAHDWACRLGWASSYCAPVDDKPAPPPRADIPA